ncbi:MmcQ-like protein [Deinococcus malanensis]|uniref:MmcQ-like protein n=1 Tax=Deinococcus malanensis TaxID=1706855 RepID=A0ABQ2ETJ5_9DEIO|nr:MmcQ/YjbR family DNA-binding protein [Deinococcus malanensis]GGK24056.1 MmcQ-like protein [Deinococcus malanensis]
MQSIAELRSACAALPQTQETFPFDASTLVFKVAGKMYALTDIHGDPLTLSLKVRPDRGQELRVTYPSIQPGYHLNKRHWVTLTLDGSVPDMVVTELLAGSYALVVRGLTRAARTDLGL